mmetsp:Transcript_69/g.170  ORF Transcript_69/g.170 Transcript_69/m.170 type:complete len:145 (-) Transcript_69:1239-1673(-)
MEARDFLNRGFAPTQGRPGWLLPSRGFNSVEDKLQRDDSPNLERLSPRPEASGQIAPCAARKMLSHPTLKQRKKVETLHPSSPSRGIPVPNDVHRARIIIPIRVLRDCNPTAAAVTILSIYFQCSRILSDLLYGLNQNENLQNI